MKNVKKNSRLSSLILMVLIAAMVLSLAACSSGDDKTNTPGAEEKTFTFEVVDPDGNVESFEISSTEQYVGAALQAEGLIQGEDGPYGLYVKTVNGLTYEYETDGCYWAFYVNGEYGMNGVDKTDIEDGATYAFKVEK